MTNDCIVCVKPLDDRAQGRLAVCVGCCLDRERLSVQSVLTPIPSECLGLRPADFGLGMLKEDSSSTFELDPKEVLDRMIQIKEEL